MRKMINLELPAPIVTEILDDLYDGLDVWRNTEEYLEGSVVAPCCVADCSSVRKARKMIKLYEETISVIEKVRRY